MSVDLPAPVSAKTCHKAHTKENAIYPQIFHFSPFDSIISLQTIQQIFPANKTKTYQAINPVTTTKQENGSSSTATG